MSLEGFSSRLTCACRTCIPVSAQHAPGAVIRHLELTVLLATGFSIAVEAKLLDNQRLACCQAPTCHAFGAGLHASANTSREPPVSKACWNPQNNCCSGFCLSRASRATAADAFSQREDSLLWQNDSQNVSRGCSCAQQEQQLGLRYAVQHLLCCA